VDQYQFLDFDTITILSSSIITITISILSKSVNCELNVNFFLDTLKDYVHFPTPQCTIQIQPTTFSSWKSDYSRISLIHNRCLNHGQQFIIFMRTQLLPLLLELKFYSHLIF